MKPAFQNTCRLCLKVGVKGYSLGKTPHKGLIESILKLKGYNRPLSEDHYACYFCMHLLSKTSNFINMVCNAQKVLYDLLKSNNSLTIPLLQNIDRHKNGLNLASLSSATFIIFTTKEILSPDACHTKRDLITKTADVKSKNKRNDLKIRQSKQDQQNKENGHVNRTVTYSSNREAIVINDSSDENVEETVKLDRNVVDAISESKDPFAVDNKSSQLLSTCIDIKVLNDPESVLMKNYIKNDESEKNLSIIESISSSDKACSSQHNKREKDNDLIAVDKKISAQLLSTYIDIEVLNDTESVSMKNYTKDDESECSLSQIESLSPRKKACSRQHNKRETDNDHIAVDKLTQPLSTCIATEAADDPESALMKNYTIAHESESSLSETSSNSSEQVSRRRRKKREVDDDYQPESTSHSEDSDFDSYDDKGIRIKRPRPDHREYPRTCDHCDSTISVLVDHYRHYQYMHPDIEYPYANKLKYPCSICGKRYTKARINPHELSHSINMKIKCSLCPRICETRRMLDGHKRYAHPKRTYTCDYCSKVFKTRTDIMRHFRIHTGEKPFKCHICGAGFAHSGNRSIHIRSSHQNYSNYTPKKQNKNQQVRRHKKYNYTDTEIESSDDEDKTQKKAKKPKRKHKIKKGNEYTNAEINSEDEKLTQKTIKTTRKVRNSAKTNDINSEHKKRTPKRMKKFR